MPTATWSATIRSPPMAARSPSGRITKQFVMPLMPGTQDVSCRRQGRRRCRWRGQRSGGATSSPGRTAAHRCTGALGPTLYQRRYRRRCSAAARRRRARRSSCRRPRGVSLPMPVTADKPTRHHRADRAHGSSPWPTPMAASSTMARSSSPTTGSSRSARGSVADPGGGADDRRRRQDDHPRPDRCPCPWAAGDRRTGAAAELVDAAESGAGHHDDPQPVEPSRSRSSPPPRCSAPGRSWRRASSRRARSSMGRRPPDVYAEIDSLDDALSHVRRLKAQGADSVKNYNQPRREQRQQVVAAAPAGGPAGRCRGRLAVRHGRDADRRRQFDAGAQYPARCILRGSRRVSVPQSTTNYTPTLVVTFGGPAGDPYWRARTDVWKNPLLTAHTPAGDLAADMARAE